ncbi:transposase [Hoeflea alexandrii]
MTDVEWDAASPRVPLSEAGDRTRTSDMREVMNAILYIACSSIPW